MTKNALTKTEMADLTVITAAAPVASMLSLPEWLTSLVNAVSQTPEGAKIWTRQPEIPSRLMPTGGQRAAIEQRCGQLERMAVAGPEKHALNSLGRLVGFYATGNLSESQAAVKAEVYMRAVNDLPAWAIDEAVDRWFRGECGERNYEFAPSPAALREIAQGVARIAAGQLVLLRRILNAKAVPEIPEEERAKQAERVRKLLDEVV
jgi:hypothetical protein